VVSTRLPRERAPALQDAAPRVRTQAAPEPRYVVPPTRRAGEARSPQRPPFGAEAGPERVPPPRPPSYGEVKKAIPPPPPVTRAQATARSQREQGTERREARPVQPSVAAPPPSAPPAPGRVEAPRARSTERREAQPVPQPVAPSAPPARRPAVSGSEQAPRGEARQERGKSKDKEEAQLPGEPASQVYRGRDRGNRDAR